jgi:hypothetical protein
MRVLVRRGPLSDSLMRVLRLALASHLFVSSAATTVYWPTGSADCPCITSTTWEVDNNGCVYRDSDHYCFPSSYGLTGCARHDWDSAPECSQLPDEQKPECVHCARISLL